MTVHHAPLPMQEVRLPRMIRMLPPASSSSQHGAEGSTHGTTYKGHPKQEQLLKTVVYQLVRAGCRGLEGEGGGWTGRQGVPLQLAYSWPGPLQSLAGW